MFSNNQIQKYSALGCSRTIKKNEIGCQPVNKPCNPFVLLQLSTYNKATQCYCNENECNIISNKFKTIVGGYFVIIVGIIGIIGNSLAFGVLKGIKKKNDIDTILTGM